MTRDLPERLDGIEDMLATITEALLEMREDARLPRLRADAGVAALARPHHHYMLFDHRGETLSLVLWFGAGPWFACADLARLSEPPPEDLADLPAAVERRVPERHRNTIRSTDTGTVSPIVDETGAALLLARWTTAMDRRDADALRRWLAETVIPSAHALMLREERIDPESPVHSPFPEAPTEVVAERFFKVYAGAIDGRDCRVVNARDIYKDLGARRAFTQWWAERHQVLGYRLDRNYARVFVKIGMYDYYLDLASARDLLWHENHPRAAELRDWLLEVEAEAGRGEILEGEAVRVVEESPTKLPTLFRFETKQLRTELEETGDPVFHANDLCGLLGYVNPRDALKKHVEKEDVVKLKVRCDVAERDITSGGPKSRARKTQTVNFVREPGLWAFLLGSEAPNAKKIKRWVTTEVLPALYRTGRYEMAGVPPKGQAVHPVSDTPLHSPLVIPFRDAQDREHPVRAVFRSGAAWFFLADLAVAAAEQAGDGEARKSFATIPEAYRWLEPTASGAVPLVAEAGLAYWLGARSHKPAAERLRDWLFKAARLALRERLDAVPTVAVPAAALVPREAHYTHRDPLYLACLALAERCFHAGESQHRRGGSAVSDNYGRFLAWLWRNAPAEGWLKIGNVSRLAGAAGIPRRSLARAIERAAAWGFAEQRPERPDGWPSEIRLVPGRLEAALDAAGVAWRG
jgi:prophage antirepressor-like protein/phage anti-repressor protein